MCASLMLCDVWDHTKAYHPNEWVYTPKRLSWRKLARIGEGFDLQSADEEGFTQKVAKSQVLGLGSSEEPCNCVSIIVEI